MFDWIVEMIDKGSYLGVFALMFLENVFPPIPSELIMPMAGLLAHQGQLNFPLVVLAGTLGSFAGQALLYYLGRSIGEERLKSFAQSHGHWVAISPDEIDATREWFRRRRGSVAVFLGRLVPGIRSMISIPAGIVKMPVPSFLFWTFLGTAVWTTALAFTGTIIGANYDRVEKFLDPVAYLVAAIIVGSYLWRVFKSYQKGSRTAGLA